MASRPTWALETVVKRIRLTDKNSLGLTGVRNRPFFPRMKDSFLKCGSPAGVAVTILALLLGGCSVFPEQPPSAKAVSTQSRHDAPIPEDLIAKMDAAGIDHRSPILLRIFKEERELEVWKKAGDGRFALLKTYPICAYSGDLGPKLRQGDRQAPEGFYHVTPGRMNPHSNYYLSFDLGYPNTFDRSLGRSGSALMVHGGCVSAGCYAMGDDGMREIYALAREAFAGGQRSFQVQALPFRMTEANLRRHRDNPNMAFWLSLKEGSDRFEQTLMEPQIRVRHGRYEVDPNAGSKISGTGSSKSLNAAIDYDLRRRTPNGASIRGQGETG